MEVDGIRGSIRYGYNVKVDTNKWVLKAVLDTHKLLRWSGDISGTGLKELSDIFLVGRLLNVDLVTDAGKVYSGAVYLTRLVGDKDGDGFEASFSGTGILNMK